MLRRTNAPKVASWVDAYFLDGPEYSPCVGGRLVAVSFFMVPELSKRWSVVFKFERQLPVGAHNIRGEYSVRFRSVTSIIHRRNVAAMAGAVWDFVLRCVVRLAATSNSQSCWTSTCEWQLGSLRPLSMKLKDFLLPLSIIVRWAISINICTLWEKGQ